MEADVVCAHGALVHHGAPEEAVARRPTRRGVPSDACATWQAHGHHPGAWGSMRSLQLEIVRQEICVSAPLCVPSMFGSRFILMNLV